MSCPSGWTAGWICSQTPESDTGACVIESMSCVCPSCVCYGNFKVFNNCDMFGLSPCASDEQVKKERVRGQGGRERAHGYVWSMSAANVPRPVAFCSGARVDRVHMNSRRVGGRGDTIHRANTVCCTRHEVTDKLFGLISWVQDLPTLGLWLTYSPISPIFTFLQATEILTGYRNINKTSDYYFQTGLTVVYV